MPADRTVRPGTGLRHVVRAVAVALLLLLSLVLVQQSRDVSGWEHWTWRVAGVAVGVLAFQLLFDGVRAARAARGRTRS